jgi:hypothetical protein
MLHSFHLVLPKCYWRLHRVRTWQGRPRWGWCQGR